MRSLITRIGVLLAVVCWAAPALAQGGGASSTGTIQGRVVDAQGAVLPGVTVTATSPALIQPLATFTSAVLRHQSGANFARMFTVSAPAGSGLTASGTGYADQSNAHRENHVWVFDVRVENSLSLTARLRLRAYVDAFNLTNSHAAETRARATGPQFMKPTAILAPFTTRFGFRLAY